MSTDITLSIIVVSWNVSRLLEACLNSIIQHVTLDASSFEVHVVDNNSSDGSAEMVARNFPNFYLIANTENLGFGRANNQAFVRCRGRYVLLLNPDTELGRESIPSMLRIMEQTPDSGIVGAKLINSDGSFQRASGGALPTLYNVAWHYLYLHQLFPEGWAPEPTFLTEDAHDTRDIGWVSGAAMLLRAEAIGEKIFNEDYFMYGEDLDLCDRMHRHGWRVLYTSNATVMHHLRQSLVKQTSSEMLATAVTGNRAYFRVRHGRTKTFLHDLILSIGYTARWLSFAALAAIRHEPSNTKRRATYGVYASASIKALCRLGG
mgnify:CR=1 FL=1